MSLAISCTQKNEKNLSDNPLLSEFKTPYDVPPFDKIKNEHFLPAFKEAIKLHDDEIKVIASNKETPTFKNTIEAIEYSGGLLERISCIFYCFIDAKTNDTLQKSAGEIGSMLSQHYDAILMNKKLFEKVKSVYASKEKLNLNVEQKRLLEKTYKNFIKSGANLNETQQKRLKEINDELSMLSQKYGDNVLREINGFKIVIDKKEDLAGLPQSLINDAAQAAKDAKMEGKWIIGLQNPVYTPFMKYSEKRNLREKLFKAYTNKGNNNNENDNKEIAKKMLSLKLEKAKMLGYKTYAEYIIEDNMAKTPEKAITFLMNLWTPALENAKEELEVYNKMIKKENKNLKIEPWDIRFYAEKLRKEKYNINDEQLKPYFEIEKVKQGMFNVLNKLYGIKIKEIADVPKYEPEICFYEIRDANDSLISTFYLDLFYRPNKKPGEWMNNYKSQYKKDGKNIRPICTVTANYSRPQKGEPALLTLSEVKSVYHEMGHVIQCSFLQCSYISLATIPRDFVELPSQILENWALYPDVLKLYAKHYKTGTTIPDSLIKKITDFQFFNQGITTTEYLAASLLDMYLHTITEPITGDIMKFEADKLNALGLIPEIRTRFRCTYFNHIFTSGYSAGYYSYTWSAMLDSDAFELFLKNGIFDRKTGESFRKNILEMGNIEEPMVLYKRFRGSEPDITPLLKKRGLDKGK